MSRFRCKVCGHEFDSERPVPPERCPAEDCNAKFGGGWTDNVVRLR